MTNVYAKWELLAAAADKIRMETYVMRVAKDGFAGYVANTSQEFEGIAGVMDDSVLSAAWHKRGPTLPLFYCHGDELSVSSMSEEDSDATETEDSSPPPDFSNLHQSSVISSASTFIGPVAAVFDWTRLGVFTGSRLGEYCQSPVSYSPL